MVDKHGGGQAVVAGRLRLLVPTMVAALLCLPAAAAAASPPVLHGTSAAVLDMNTGQVLWQQNGDQHVPMASTTKMMTALVALELEGNQVGMTMRVPPEVSQAYGEMIGLVPGTSYTLQQLLEGMILPSANDAAIAVAVDSAGTEARFVALMNYEAQLLGLWDTHYANPDGLDDPGQYSSAIDLARLGAVAMENPVIRSIVGMRAAEIPSPDGTSTLVIGNINPLLGTVPGVNGIKTGYTSEALNLAVESATRGGTGVIAVVTGEPAYDLTPDATNLLNYGFALAGSGPALPPIAAAPAVNPAAKAVSYSTLAAEEAVLRGTPAPPGIPVPAPLRSAVTATTGSAFVSAATVTKVPVAPTASATHQSPAHRWWGFGGMALLVIFAGRSLRAARRRATRRARAYGPTAWQALERYQRSASGE